MVYLRLKLIGFIEVAESAQPESTGGRGESRTGLHLINKQTVGWFGKHYEFLRENVNRNQVQLSLAGQALFWQNSGTQPVTVLVGKGVGMGNFHPNLAIEKLE